MVSGAWIVVFELLHTEIPGCYELVPSTTRDSRGHFTKVFHAEWFKQHGLETTCGEEYYSVSGARVLRGMHFQLPPHDHAKLVYVIHGEVMDVVVDLRVGSPAYGHTVMRSLNGATSHLMYLPKGVGHGFYVPKSATMVYRVSTAYSATSDAGVLWSSIDVPWPEKAPILSKRDGSFAPLQAFVSPFRFE